MTITNTTTFVRHTVDDGTPNYNFGFPGRADSEVYAKVVDALGVDTVLANPADFTVVWASDDSGGHIVLSAGAQTAHDTLRMVVYRITSPTQEQPFKNLGHLYYSSAEEAHDKAARILQETSWDESRNLAISETDESSDPVALTAQITVNQTAIAANAAAIVNSADRVLLWDSDADETWTASELEVRMGPYDLTIGIPELDNYVRYRLEFEGFLTTTDTDLFFTPMNDEGAYIAQDKFNYYNKSIIVVDTDPSDVIQENDSMEKHADATSAPEVFLTPGFSVGTILSDSRRALSGVFEFVKPLIADHGLRMKWEIEHYRDSATNSGFRTIKGSLLYEGGIIGGERMSGIRMYTDGAGDPFDLTNARARFWGLS